VSSQTYPGPFRSRWVVSAPAAGRMPKSESSNAKAIARSVQYLPHLGRRQCSEFPFQFYRGDCLDLLKMKRTGFRNVLGILNSQRLPRSEVVWRRTVTRSSSSGAGLPVSNSAGRTFAVIPKSVIQTSPGAYAGHPRSPGDRASSRPQEQPGCKR
jgi:hypothetical protein